MKNILFILIAVCLSGCIHEDEDKLFLISTKWHYSYNGESRYIHFTSESDFVMNYNYNGNTDSWSGKYTYNHPAVILDDGKNKFSLNIKGDDMISDINEDGDAFVYSQNPIKGTWITPLPNDNNLIYRFTDNFEVLRGYKKDSENPFVLDLEYRYTLEGGTISILSLSSGKNIGEWRYDISEERKKLILYIGNIKYELYPH
ncbi:MAG: hypothetical protein LBV32_01705 [Tannerellaceae bacterium]|jgi:hypothetical protein|nr:hypothetical protein [Tannerellaceae bacterium]